MPLPVLPTLTRTLALIALTMLAGGFAFNLLVLRGKATAALRETTQSRRRAWLTLWLVATTAALILDTLAQLEDQSAVRLTLLVIRIVVLTALLFSLRANWSESLLAIGLCGLLLLVQSLSGHATQQAEWALSVLADWLHIAFAAVWLGGVAYFAAVIAPQVLSQRVLVKELGASIEKFSPLALSCVLVIALTGIAQSASFVGSFDALFNTVYGRALLIKLMVFLVLIAFGAFHQFVIGPQLTAWRAKAESQEQAALRFRVSIVAESAISLIALAAAAAMTVLPLARGVAE
jgi:copper transport protein